MIIRRRCVILGKIEIVLLLFLILICNVYTLSEDEAISMNNHKSGELIWRYETGG
jgi:hypothetical protein